jgi:hypothetical protein
LIPPYLPQRLSLLARKSLWITLKTLYIKRKKLAPKIRAVAALYSDRLRLDLKIILNLNLR